jgi:hypothetical protein
VSLTLSRRFLRECRNHYVVIKMLLNIFNYSGNQKRHTSHLVESTRLSSVAMYTQCTTYPWHLVYLFHLHAALSSSSLYCTHTHTRARAHAHTHTTFQFHWPSSSVQMYPITTLQRKPNRAANNCKFQMSKMVKGLQCITVVKSGRALMYR